MLLHLLITVDSLEHIQIFMDTLDSSLRGTHRFVLERSTLIILQLFQAACSLWHLSFAKWRQVSVPIHFHRYVSLVLCAKMILPLSITYWSEKGSNFRDPLSYRHRTRLVWESSSAVLAAQALAGDYPIARLL